MDLRKFLGPLLRDRVNRMAGHVIPALVTPGNLLDIGCSSGLVVQEIQRRTGMDVTGCDVLCPAGSTFPVVLYDGRTLPFPDGSFTNVMLSFVLHHCDDPDHALREAARVCRRRLIVIEDIADTPFQLKMAIFHDWYANKITVPDMRLPYHFRSTQEWRRVFDSVGLKVARSYPSPSMAWNPVPQTLFALDKE